MFCRTREPFLLDAAQPPLILPSSSSVLTQGQQWKLALEVLEELKTTFGPNVIAYSAAISALSKVRLQQGCEDLWRRL